MLSGRYYPRSFTILVIVAMGVLIVPLASGLINVVHVLQGVVDTQRQFTRNSLGITREVRQIVESVSQLQRAAGQYHLLQDTEFGGALRMRFSELQTQLTHLDTQLVDAPSRATLTTLQTRSRALYRQVQPGRFLDSTDFHALAPDFDALHAAARTLLTQGDTAVQRELKTLEATVQATRQRLILLALALIPLTLLLAAVFSWLINRPIKQLKASIQQLGRADLGPLRAISGPQDIVELGREIDWLRQRLQALEEQKLRFLRHVSHELKTPLASLREGVALLDDELAGSLNARQRSIVTIMDGSSRDLQKRIEDLIRYGSLVRDATLPPRAPLQALAGVLDSMLARHRLALDARRIAVETQLDAPMLHADRSQLETVLDNLLSNAIKFSPEDGRILIRSELSAGATLLDVCDQSGGIPEAERSRVFEPFFQGARQPDSAVKGSGLGLSIVRETLLTAGGQIEIVDRPPWTTCFRTTWPLPQ
ncbi:MAG TPA: HAMP domain-containing sensor histidine kinase [Thiobacillus sp.]|nr:MAG: two-component sensor histidine kinase [Hydrogenophilales bacterium 28-61-11]OYZ56691.1 MAG: two-component sensor histidine kinase [Hydrogenophilales bacterium 16-61-112]OZA46296.1 MAG: two-component sensor histidine kinase [Hydrogenophilales bacterium 17-61-76]HQT31141.1 HAMP domain-containing sensor histidine kinase [Thiobacillus sp.]HQT68802.1 HAMP domain-containing sensor histidine kinase [Thiobacillus sp.]